MVSIYALTDPTDGKIYYVGASVNPQKRTSTHLWEANIHLRFGGIPHLCKAKTEWLAGLIKQKKRPVLVILEEVEKQFRADREQYWIERKLAEGCPLLNHMGVNTR